MENLINITQKTHQILCTPGIETTFKNLTFAILGNQFSGKSTLLEAFIGKKFIPESLNIPLLIHISNLKDESDFCIFSHKSEIKYTDFDKINQELLNCKKNSENFEGFIELTINMKNSMNLTLIEFPIFNAMSKKNNEEMMKIICSENCINLVLLNSTEDIFKNEILQIIKEADPKLVRTIGILTKFDLAEDKEYFLKQCEKSELKNLKFNYHILAQNPENELIKESENYLSMFHIKFYSPKCSFGLNALFTTMSRYMTQYFKLYVPRIKSEIQPLLTQKTNELTQFSKNDNDLHAGGNILYLISRFSENYKAALDGSIPSEISSKVLQGGARILHIFHDLFMTTISSMKALDKITDNDIRTVIANSKSIHPNLFIPMSAFENLAKEQIKRLLEPSLTCLKLVNEELKRIIMNPTLDEYKQNLMISEKIQKVMLGVINKFYNITNGKINDLILIQTEYINLAHPDVLSGAAAIVGAVKSLPESENVPIQYAHYAPKRKIKIKGLTSSISKKEEPLEEESNPNEGFPFVRKLPEKMRSAGPSSSREILETEVIKQLLVSYFEMVKKSISDLVPKTIVAFFVNSTKEKMQEELLEMLYEPEKEKLLKSEGDEKIARNKCAQEVDLLKEALRELNKFMLMDS